MRESMPQLTIVIPTRNRHFLLSKLFGYYMQSIYQGGYSQSVKLMVGDASDSNVFEENRELFKHYANKIDIAHFQHSTDITTVNSTVIMLDAVTTPYCVWAGDDDFLVPRQLENCVRFLNGHADYSLAGGVATWVYVNGLEDGNLKIDFARPGTHKTIQSSRASQRLIEYCTPACFVNTFSVQRTVNMREIWRKTFDLGLCHDRCYSFIQETAHNVVSLIRGRQMCFDGLYHVMIRHNQKFGHSKYVDFFERMVQWEWQSCIGKTVTWWAEELAEHEEISLDNAKKIAAAIFFRCIMVFMERYQSTALSENNVFDGRHFFQNLFGRLSKADVYSLKKIWSRLKMGKNKLSLSLLLNPKSQYHDDFISIYDVLTKTSPQP